MNATVQRSARDSMRRRTPDFRDVPGRSEHFLGSEAAAGHRPVVFGTRKASGVSPLSPREERAGREPERGEIDKKRLLSPALSSFFEEERERKRGCPSKQIFGRTQLVC